MRTLVFTLAVLLAGCGQKGPLYFAGEGNNSAADPAPANVPVPAAADAGASDEEPDPNTSAEGSTD